MTPAPHIPASLHKKEPFLKNCFARIWAIWGLVSFAVTFLIIFIPSMCSYLMPTVQGQRYFIIVSKIWMDVWLRLILCKVTVHGKEHFKPGENYIVVFNHNALLDVPLSAPYVPGPNKTIAKSSFAKVPLFGFFYSRGAILVNRKDPKSRQRSIDAMKQVLKMGIHMCIYPEGTRNRTAEPLKPFYEGAFRLATDTGKSIIPCVIEGTSTAMPIHKTFYLFPTPLKMTFLPAEPSTDISSEALKDDVYNKMKAFYTRNRF